MARILFLIVLMSLPHVALAEGSGAHQFCQMNWASEPEKKAACVDAQIAGAREVIRYLSWAKTSLDAASLHIIDAFELCKSRWEPDFEQISACLTARAQISPP